MARVDSTPELKGTGGAIAAQIPPPAFMRFCANPTGRKASNAKETSELTSCESSRSNAWEVACCSCYPHLTLLRRLHVTVCDGGGSNYRRTKCSEDEVQSIIAWGPILMG